MNILIFEYEHMAIEDLCEALTNLGHTYTVITDEQIYDRANNAFAARFDSILKALLMMLFSLLIIFQSFLTAARSTIYLILHLYMTHRWFHCIPTRLSIHAIMYFYLTSRLIWSLKKKISKLFIICRLPSIPAGWIR